MKKIFLLLFAELCCFHNPLFAQPLTVNIQYTTPCNHDGKAWGVVTGGSGPFTYTWNIQPQVGPYYLFYGDTIIGLAGNETISVDVSNGTQIGNYFNLFIPPPFYIYWHYEAAICPNPVLKILDSITGGITPAQVYWILNGVVIDSATDTLQIFSGAPYDLLVVDSNGCSFSTQQQDSSALYGMLPGSNININLTTTTSHCHNGTAIATSSGCIGNCSYSWSNGMTGDSVGGLFPGWYYLTVIDSIGCQSSTSFTIYSTPPALTTNATPTPATCLNNDGAITSYINNAVYPVHYTWNTGDTTAAISNIPSGYYHMTAVDDSGCIGQISSYVASTSPITVSISTTNSSCLAPTGSISLTIGGGTPPYIVTWNTIPQLTGISLTNLFPSIYSFSIVDSVGCIKTGLAQVWTSPPLIASIYAIQPVCPMSNGTANMSVSLPAALTVNYSWNTGDTTPVITGLSQGFYSCTITDTNGCQLTKSVYLNATSPISIGGNIVNTSCIYVNDGSITAIPSGGLPPYSYVWWPSFNTTQTLSGLLPGTYTVTVHDANGCATTQTFYVGYNSTLTCAGTIAGTVYNDLNQNCTIDAGELGIPNQPVYCNGITQFTSATGNFSFTVPPGTYNLIHHGIGYCHELCPSGGISSVTVAASGLAVTDLADTLEAIIDMEVHRVMMSQPIVGASYLFKLLYKNAGTIQWAPSALSSDEGYLPTPVLNPAGASISFPNEWQWSFPAMNPGDVQTVIHTYSVPVSVPISYPLIYRDTITPYPTIDNTPWNNVNYATDLTVASFDPNYKEVEPRGTGANGLISLLDTVFDFTIHFENTGNYMAQKVVVTDTLDSHLNPVTLEPILASHNFVAEIRPGNVLRFTFDNIFLPANSGLASQGYFIYRIHVNNLPQPGWVIKNNAEIFFDYNQPISTNTTINTYCAPVIDSISAAICQGDSFLVSGHYFSTAGAHYITIPGVANCDTIILLSLTMLNPVFTNSSATICLGDTFQFGSNGLISTGIYSDTLQGTNTCDSVSILNLSVLNPVTDSNVASICAGDTFLFGGMQLTLAGVYDDTLAGINSCDSVSVLTLNLSNLNLTITLDSGGLLLHGGNGTMVYWIDCFTHEIVDSTIGNIFTSGMEGAWAAVQFNGVCYDTSNCEGWGGIPSNTKESQFSLHPNPAGSEIFLRYSSDENFQVEFINVLGQIVMQKKNLRNGWFDISNLTPGLYTVRLYSGLTNYRTLLVATGKD